MIDKTLLLIVVLAAFPLATSGFVFIRTVIRKIKPLTTRTPV